MTTPVDNLREHSSEQALPASLESESVQYSGISEWNLEPFDSLWHLLSTIHANIVHNKQYQGHQNRDQRNIQEFQGGTQNLNIAVQLMSHFS